MPGAQVKSVPIIRHQFLRGRGVGKGARVSNRGLFTPISGAEALSAPSTYMYWIKIEGMHSTPRCQKSGYIFNDLQPWPPFLHPYPRESGGV